MQPGTKRASGSWAVHCLTACLLLWPATPAAEWRVARIIDGDTLEVTQGTRVERVRIDRIDAPERGTRASCDLERRRAEAASAALARLAPVGGVVDLVGARRDLYGRLLADVIAGGLSVGPELVRQGHARWWNGRRPKPEWCGPSIR
jgi:endonuclease YncB( thermonuclease family)